MAALQVLPEVTYAVRLPTAHPIHENFRVCLFQQMLQGPLDDPDCVANLGELMYQVSLSRTWPVRGSLSSWPAYPPAQTSVAERKTLLGVAFDRSCSGTLRFAKGSRQPKPASQGQRASWHSTVRELFLHHPFWGRRGAFRLSQDAHSSQSWN